MCNCSILHEEDEACPYRIAQALRSIVAQKDLKDADRIWIANHPTFNIDKLIEHAVTTELVSEKLRIISESQEARKEAGSFIPCQLCSQYDGDGLHFVCRVGIHNCINKNSRASKQEKERKPRVSSEVVSNKGWKIPDSVVQEALK